VPDRLFTPDEANAALEQVRALVEQLTEAGVVVRYPDSGLIDFPSMRDGEPVFLCWQLGEDDVAWWHGPDEGFAGRKPLE
jgi:hypothetical protein